MLLYCCFALLLCFFIAVLLYCFLALLLCCYFAMNVCEKMNLAGCYRAKKNLRWQWWLFWIIVIIISASGTIFFDWQFPAEYLDFTVKSISASLGNVVFQNIVLQPQPEFFQGSILIVQIFFQDIYLTVLHLLYSGDKSVGTK